MNEKAKEIRQLKKHHRVIGNSKFVYQNECPSCKIKSKIFSSKRQGSKCDDCLNEIIFCIQALCDECGQSFKMSKYQQKNGRRLCSTSCTGNHRKLPSHVPYKCDGCGKNCKVERKGFKEYKRHFCSKDCHLKNSKGEFSKLRNQAKLQKLRTFKFEGTCVKCKKKNQIYRTCIRARNCQECVRVKERNHSKFKRDTDPQFKIALYLRKRIKQAFYKKRINKVHKSGAIENLTGCSIVDLVKHIESKFTAKMTWGNYGSYWHLDHIIPISSFDLADPKQSKQANHWTNLQPLEAAANISKSNTMTQPQMSLMLNL